MREIERAEERMREGERIREKRGGENERERGRQRE